MGITGEDIEKLLLATVLGAIIGMDREYRGKPAGLRTLMLVSLGSVMFTLVSVKMALLDPLQNSDVTRIASNIATGIGFIGAGIIFKREQDVHGLTTAATVWAAAAIAMTVGAGAYWLAIIATAITWLTLFVLHYVEGMMESLQTTVKYTVSWKGSYETLKEPKVFFQGRSYKLKQTRLQKSAELITVDWTVKASKQTHEVLVEQLLQDPQVAELTY
jgi:putative Mg2+ transporter-C (MgtC) family protein